MGRTEGKALGVAVATIEHWLHTKENLAPDLLEEVKAGSRHDVPHRTFEKLATILPQQAELQKLVLEKAEKEDLTSTQVQQVAKAVKQTTNPVELRSILNRPVARTSEELTREARVENLLLREAREPTRVDSFLSPGGRGLRWGDAPSSLRLCSGRALTFPLGKGEGTDTLPLPKGESRRRGRLVARPYYRRCAPQNDMNAHFVRDSNSKGKMGAHRRPRSG